MASIESFQGQIIKCKAAVCYGTKQPLIIETIDVAPPKSGEVRIKIIATGVCHTDLHSIDSPNAEIFPLIFGHEGAGIVESVGENVTSVAVGDRVIPSCMPQCNECENCKNPVNNFCEKLRFTSATQPGVFDDGTTRFSINGKPIYHFMNVASFSEYTVVYERSCCKINPLAPLEKVCLLGCGIGTGYGAVFNIAKVRPGSTVGVWGLGGIGMAVVMSAKLAGASKIVGIDMNVEKFKLAKEMGATDCLNPKEFDKPFQQVIAEKYPGGFDATFECIGNVNVMRVALECTRIGHGVCCIIGLAHAGETIAVDAQFLLLGITIKGSCIGGIKSRDDMPKLVEKYLKNEIEINKFITNEFKLEKINEALDLLRQSKGIRSIIHM